MNADAVMLTFISLKFNLIFLIIFFYVNDCEKKVLNL